MIIHNIYIHERKEEAAAREKGAILWWIIATWRAAATERGATGGNPRREIWTSTTQKSLILSRYASPHSVCSFPFELCKYGKDSADCAAFLYKLAPTKVNKYHPDFKPEQLEQAKDKKEAAKAEEKAEKGEKEEKGEKG